MKNENGVMYVVHAGGACKIGCASSRWHARKRLAVVQSCCPLPARLLFCKPMRSPRRAETFWHDVFAAQRLTGEWYKLSICDLAAMRRPPSKKMVRLLNAGGRLDLRRMCLDVEHYISGFKNGGGHNEKKR